jgi:hypothetical protein
MKSDVLSIIAVLLVAFLASSTASRERGIPKSLNKAQKQCQKYGDGCEYSTEVTFDLQVTTYEGQLSPLKTIWLILNDNKFRDEVLAAAQDLLGAKSPVIHLSSAQKGGKGKAQISILFVEGSVPFAFYKERFLVLHSKYMDLLGIQNQREWNTGSPGETFTITFSGNLAPPQPQGDVGGSNCSPCGCGRTWKGCCSGCSCQTNGVCGFSGALYGECCQPGCCNGASCFTGNKDCPTICDDCFGTLTGCHGCYNPIGDRETSH